MSEKLFAQHSDIVNVPSIPQLIRRPVIFMGIATILLLVLAFVMVGQGPIANEAASVNPSVAIPYNNALEMQYAQPWLNNSVRESAASAEYGDAMAMQYAQPWLDSIQKSAVMAHYNALELQYAQPWLNVQSANEASAVEYGNALEMQYARPYLTK